MGKYRQLFQLLGWTAAVYELTQSNLITRDPTDADFVVTNGAIRSRGFETDLTGKITDNLMLRSRHDNQYL